MNNQERSQRRRFDLKFWEASTIIVLVVLFGLRIAAQRALAQQSNSDHGSDFSTVTMALSKEKYEVLALFGRDGTKLLEWTDEDVNQVDIPGKWILMANYVSLGSVTMLHNHPIDSTFSTNDLIAAASTNYKRQVVVTSTHVYMLEALQGWPDVAATKEFVSRNVDKNPRAEAEGLVVRGQVTPDSQEGFYSTNLLIEKYAEEFGIDYTVSTFNQSLG